MTPCEELGYKVGDRFEILHPNDVDSSIGFKVGSLVELYHDDGSKTPKFKLIKGQCQYLNAGGAHGGYWGLSRVKKIKNGVSNMTIKTNDKVKFSDAAKGLKSYDADAVGVVTLSGDDKATVVFTKSTRTKKTITLGLKHIELIEEEKITLQPGDFCNVEDMEFNTKRAIKDAFASASFGEGEWEEQSEAVWTWMGVHPESKSIFFYDGEDCEDLNERQLTYSQIINATNAKPKENAVKEPEATESKPAQKPLDAALCELTTLNKQIAALTKQRDDAQEYIKQRNAAHGVSVEFGVAEPEKSKLNITDWRDLLPGDVIEVVKTDDKCFTVGAKYEVELVDSPSSASNYPIDIVEDDEGDGNSFGGEWKLISRQS